MSDLEFRGSDFGLADWRDNLGKSVDEFIDTVEREIVEKELAKFGYVEVTFCRDCEWNVNGACAEWDYCDIGESNGFCHKAKRRGE